MSEDRRRQKAVENLRAALESENDEEKNYHVRQTLQLLELDDESTSDAD